MANTSNQALPIGYQLNDYKIVKVLSTGGFSLVYLAHDQNKRTVAIKEYMPTNLALREDGHTVLINTEDDSVTFKHGLKCFFEEGLALAKIDHKNIIRVLNFFRANNTVYMVMQYERGKPLQDFILAQEQPLDEAFVRKLFAEMLNGLREVHSQKLLHLDIKPANIYIRQDNSPVLLDFGSARQILTGVHAKLVPSFTPGFASPEHYIDRKQLGPWSDIYSLGASMYSCLSRASPLAANLRTVNDVLIPAQKLGKNIYSEHFLIIIDSCLALNPLERPKSVFSLQKDLMQSFVFKEKKLSKIGQLKKFLNSSR